MKKKDSPPNWVLQAAGGQTQGQRQDQEDTWQLDLLDAVECLASVADGLGGHPSGDVASREAVAQFHAHVAAQRKKGNGPVRKWLEGGVVQADEHLREMQVQDAKLEGMATTFVGAYVRRRELSVVSVGDSYALLQREGKLSRLNELHSEGGGVTSCVGFNLARIDLLDNLLLQPGDRLLLASDGIATLQEDEIAAMLREAPDAESAVRDLLGAVEDAGAPHQDNTTLVAIFFTE